MRISVIIPTLNEETMIAEAICSAMAPGVEIIVVDGGSTDRTFQIAESYGVVVLHSPQGRAPQMNAGAAAARALCDGHHQRLF
jgi:glycosyltransferase involved in cell wall biosynthesis